MENSESGNVLIKKSTFNSMIIGIIVAVGIAAFFVGTYTSNLNSNQITEKDLDDVIAKLELKLLQNQLSSEKSTIPKKISLDDDPMKGNPNAPITIIEFSDFQCPFCWRFYTQTLPLIEQNYISTGKVNFVYRDFPIESIHPNAFPTALAAECADDQDKFWQMHDVIFKNQNNWKDLQSIQTIELLKQYASEIGLDRNEFDSCLDSKKYLEEIRNDLNDGRIYGVTGTPGFFVGNEKIGFTKMIGAQPFSSFQKVIDGQLE